MKCEMYVPCGTSGKIDFNSINEMVLGSGFLSNLRGNLEIGGSRPNAFWITLGILAVVAFTVSAIAGVFKRKRRRR